MSKDGKIGVGVIGYGYWGPNLVRNYMELKNCSLKYICDKASEKLVKAKIRYPNVKCTTDYKEVINDPEVDAVVIATPISTHHALAKQAILKGKHVFVEKPMADNTAHAQELVDLAKHAGVTLMVGHTFVYSPPVVKTKEIIDAGELGKIFYVSSSRVNLGLHQKDASVVWDLAPHDISILIYWLEEEPQDIYAYGRGCVTSHIPDVAFLNINFPSGIVAHLHLSWLSPVKLRRTTIIGNKKMLLYDDTDNSEKVRIFDHGVDFEQPKSYGEYQLSYRTGDVLSPRIDNYEPLFKEAVHFLECIETGKTPCTDGVSGVQVVRAIEMAETSLRQNGNFVKGEPWTTPKAMGRSDSSQMYI